MQKSRKNEAEEVLRPLKICFARIKIYVSNENVHFPAMNARTVEKGKLPVEIVVNLFS